MTGELNRREVLQAAAAVGLASAARDFSGMREWLSAPNYFVLGAALPEDRVTPVFEGFHHATLSLRSFALRA